MLFYRAALSLSSKTLILFVGSGIWDLAAI